MSSEDDVWERVERHAVHLLGNGEAATALKDLEEFLATMPSSASVCAALSYRAMAKEDLGDLPGALKDQLQAHALSHSGTYNRYTLELSLGSLYVMTGQLEEAASWLRAALQTVLEGAGISGGSALRKFLDLRHDESLSPVDRALCVGVVRQSWKVLRQPGEPDLTNLAAAAEFLVDLGSKPLPASGK